MPGAEVPSVKCATGAGSDGKELFALLEGEGARPGGFHLADVDAADAGEGGLREGFAGGAAADENVFEVGGVVVEGGVGLDGLEGAGEGFWEEFDEEGGAPA